jgi:hypothetical protein
MFFLQNGIARRSSFGDESMKIDENGKEEKMPDASRLIDSQRLQLRVGSAKSSVDTTSIDSRKNVEKEA